MKTIHITVSKDKKISVVVAKSEEIDEFELLVGMQKKLKGKSLRSTRSAK